MAVKYTLDFIIPAERSIKFTWLTFFVLKMSDLEETESSAEEILLAKHRKERKELQVGKQLDLTFCFC